MIEVFTTVTMKNAVFWVIETQFVPHRRHITSPLQSPARKCYVRFEAFTTVTMKKTIFWDMTLCGPCEIRRFGGMYRLHHQGVKNWTARNNVFRLLVTANIVPSLPILVILLIEAIHST
jgi:hypothetical protein